MDAEAKYEWDRLKATTKKVWWSGSDSIVAWMLLIVPFLFGVFIGAWLW